MQIGLLCRSLLACRQVSYDACADLREAIRAYEEIEIPVQNGWLEIDTISDFETADTRFTDGSIVEFFDPDSDISSPSRDQIFSYFYIFRFSVNFQLS